MQSYPSGADRIPISTGGGFLPRWSRDGRELFYITGDAVAAVVIRPDGSFGPPRRLFDKTNFLTSRFRSYDTSPDGKRFLMIQRDVDRDVVVVRMSAFERASGCLITKQVWKTLPEREQEVTSTVFTSSDPFAGPIVFDWVVSVEALWRFVRSLTIPARVMGSKRVAIPSTLPSARVLVVPNQ